MSNNISHNLEKGKRIGFVESCWHHEIVEQARISFVCEMQSAGISSSLIDIITVPGSLEIPLQCQIMAHSARYQILVAAGFIIDGRIYRHDFVASTVLDGMMRVQLDTGVPVLSVVLTPHHFNDQKVHHDFFCRHFKIKGEEAASACVHIMQNQHAERLLEKQSPGQNNTKV